MTAAGKRYMARVAELPCVICHEWELPQQSPTQVHHCIHGRFSTKRAPDTMTIPLCEGHHQGLFDTSKVALHRNPAQWREQYGDDTDWLSWVEKHLNHRGPKIAVRRKCAVEHCDRRQYAGEFCFTHYHRNKKYGDPNAGTTSPGAIHAWLNDHKDYAEKGACLLWPFSRRPGYYSVKLPSGQYTKAHRIMCFLAHGEPPDGAFAIHSCGNKSCVNPNHLRWGTPAENTADAKKHGTLRFGSKCRQARLCEADVITIRERWANGETLDQLAKNFPATRSAIWMAATRRTWRHVN